MKQNSGSLVIREVKSRKEYRDFVNLPYRLYKDSPYWVPQLISDEKTMTNLKKHPFVKQNKVVFYVCYRNGEAVGRIAGIINQKHIDLYRDDAAFFGFFESVHDPAVSDLLFRSATGWVKSHGAQLLRGPTNYSLNDISGMLVEGFDESPYILMPYNPPYYESLYQSSGLNLAMRFFAYEVTADTIKFPNFIHRLEQRLRENDIRIRNFDFKNIKRDAAIIVDLFNSTWDKNWGFTPISYSEALEDFRKVKAIAREDLIFIAEYKDTPIGFSLALPDVNQALKPLNGRLLPFNWIKLLRNIKKINRIRVLLMGVKEAYRSKGVDLMFYKKIVDNSLAHNYHTAELSWILEDNKMMNRVLDHINAKKSKTYGIFEKVI
jgi:hypothetical protein